MIIYAYQSLFSNSFSENVYFNPDFFTLFQSFLKSDLAICSKNILLLNHKNPIGSVDIILKTFFESKFHVGGGILKTAEHN